MIFVELKVVKNRARAQVEVDESWIDAMERKEAKEREVWDSFWSLLTIPESSMEPSWGQGEGSCSAEGEETSSQSEADINQPGFVQLKKGRIPTTYMHTYEHAHIIYIYI